MCVTSAPAVMGGTRAFTLATLDGPKSRHISGYQNQASNLSHEPNCMLLHFPAHHLQLLRGPELTHWLMDDMTASLPELQPVPRMRGGKAAYRGAAEVEHYGDYDVVLAQNPGEMLSALDDVEERRRPKITPSLERMVQWYHDRFGDYAFVLACFDGAANPKHPIVVEYTPHSDDVLFIPGLDAHDGSLPIVGQQMERNFRIAFAAEDRTQPIHVNYREALAGMQWAPDNVTGFYDNRPKGPNDDYVLPLEVVDSGFVGNELLAELIAS